jgi:hypothetical protein
MDRGSSERKRGGQLLEGDGLLFGAFLNEVLQQRENLRRHADIILINLAVPGHFGQFTWQDDSRV